MLSQRPWRLLHASSRARKGQSRQESGEGGRCVRRLYSRLHVRRPWLLLCSRRTRHGRHGCWSAQGGPDPGGHGCYSARGGPIKGRRDLGDHGCCSAGAPRGSARWCCWRLPRDACKGTMEGLASHRCPCSDRRGAPGALAWGCGGGRGGRWRSSSSRRRCGAWLDTGKMALAWWPATGKAALARRKQRSGR